MYLETVVSETSIPSFSNHHGFEARPKADWPGTFVGLNLGSLDRHSVGHGGGSSTANSIGNLVGASEQPSLALRCGELLASQTTIWRSIAKTGDLYQSALAEDCVASRSRAAAEERDFQLPDHAVDATSISALQRRLSAT
jgi:hypothetical protein